ncbi:MAG: hypothetical protein KJ646_05810 [Nanoarchaeota archaeon]|nr:hypothetical protein [Nanoarchaeota archaeon]MBU4116382.1 hypothetical protein [Nanoarchaeota archaeon]
MGIQIEFNPDLALRKYGIKGRLETECFPQKLEEGKVYSFLKKGQRNYWLEGEIPLLETKGNQNLSRPLASIIILEATHFLKDNEAYTKGKYKVIDVFKINDLEIHFESYRRK